MELEEIKRYVTDWLTFSGVERKDMEVQVYEALHHLLTAMKLYDLMDAEDRAFVSEFVSLRMNHFLNVKISIKTKSQERKGRKEKKSSPSYSPNKEKTQEAKAEKTTHTVCDADSGFDEDLLKRYEIFAKKCEKYVGKYGREMIDNFVRYWSLPNQATGKMQFEEKTYWSLKPMLESWSSKSYTKKDAAAAMSLTKTQKKQQKEQADTKAQQEQAAEREAANARREQEQEAAKAGAVTADEQIARNPDGILARLRREREAKENAKKTTD